MFNSPHLSHHEYVDGVLALVVAVTTSVGYVSSVYWERAVVPRLFRRRELTLAHQISELEEEAERVCATSKLFEHSRLTRKALRLRQELEAERGKRLAYECSVARVFPWLLDGVLFMLRLTRPTREATVAAAAPESMGAAILSNKPRTFHDPSNTTATSSSMRTRDSTYLPTAPHGWRVLAEHAMHALWYNAATFVKYLLRFGSAVVLLCVYGNQPMFSTASSAFEKTPRHCATEVMPPFLLKAVLAVSDWFLAPPRRGLSSNASISEVGDDAVSVTNVGFAAAAPPGSSAYSFAAEVHSTSDTDTPAGFERVHLRLYESTNLLSWFLACYLATYLAVRVFHR
ncbi:hypothetical protein JKF63_02101 [Porcisia hertigi]|uniref:Uncharacterized protein n=1 Tax=Porcisia hertigi TaxID=2761500 RepID=A0A836I7K8_9TRYP|nr:hypothetical protein JKF63_02101 [Porcisia hertigi]